MCRLFKVKRSCVNHFWACVHVRACGGQGDRVERLCSRIPRDCSHNWGGTSDFVPRWQMVG